MTEIQLQAAAFQWTWNEYPETRRCFFAVPNGGTRNKIEATQLKASGLVAGIPDMIFVWRGRVYGYEFKTETGVVSPAQKLAHEAWHSTGTPVFVVRTLEEFKNLFFAHFTKGV